MMEYQKHYNIMTSCDDGLVPYVMVNLTSIAYHLKDAAVDFFLLHSRISAKNLVMLKALCRKYSNITFREILVPNPEIYTELAKYGSGWVGEAYYSLNAHMLLPDDVDRVLYLDAGDTLVIGDIAPYYNYDFQGKSLVVTGSKFKVTDEKWEMFEVEDLGETEDLLPALLLGVFNSGSYMMNLDQMRRDNRSLADYQYLVEILKGVLKKDDSKIYWGDQGLLSAAFVGNMRYYAYPEKADIWYMPYNFCIWYFDRVNEPPDYQPAIIHFAGTKFKPWDGLYPIYLERFQKKENLHSLRELKIGQAEYFYMWHEYAILTDRVLKKIGY